MSTAYQTQTPSTRNQDASLSAILASHLRQDSQQHMDSRQSEYPQSGLSSPNALYSEHRSEDSTIDQASAVQYQPNHDYKPANFSSSATPNPEYGLPQSARSGSFPEYIQRSYTDGQQGRYPASATGGHTGMAQTSSPSTPASDDHNISGHASLSNNSDANVPIDPSIAQSSPGYPPPHNYSPYPPQQDMQQQYAAQPMAYGRPDWAGQYHQPMGYGHPAATSGGGAPGMVAHAMPRPPAVCDRLRKIAGRLKLILPCRAATLCQQCILSYPYPAHSSTNDHEDDMKRSSECTNAGGTAAKRHTEH